MTRTRHPILPAALAGLIAMAAVPSADAGPRETIIATFASQAGTPLSAARGKAFFMGTHSGGKPDLNSCTVCHTRNLHGAGKTRVGKPIDPMAVSANPARFTDPKKVAKWFRRNCKSVLGRECTASEKGDILIYLSGI
ncbi:MAG: DUF1924 domain-containing protein [Paracoccaceae bacterium]